MSQSHFSYPVDLIPDNSSRILARIKDVTGCVTDGADRAEALHRAADALEEALCAAMAAHEDIPVASAAAGRPVVAPGAVVAAKIALYQAMREGKRSNVWLAKQLDVAESEVRRMLDPKHATKIGRLEEALAALGRRMIISVEVEATWTGNQQLVQRRPAQINT